MKQNPRIRRGFTLVELLVVIVIIAALAGLTAPMVIKQRKKADQTEAVNNAKQIGLAMFEFENEYGSFPQGSLGDTINDRVGATGTTAPTTITYSNDAFKQLMVSDIAKSEQMFFCKTSFSRVKPDNNTSGTTNMLKPGEVGFCYMLYSDDTALSSSVNPSTPLVVAPLSSTTSTTFDKNIYDSKGIVLRVDQSVSSLNINTSGELVLVPASSGATAQTLTTTGAGTVWDDKTPKMVPPQ
jgi:prepilin-type N-terminal cleavage/methylation domain-containing protein